MYQLLKIGLISSLCFFSQYAHTQTVDQATFDEAIDYINCRIAEISFQDQATQPHIVVFLKETDNCNMEKYNGSFITVLKAFLRQRRLGKNEQLATFINAFKLKYQPNYNDADQYKLVIDTLLKSNEILAFQQKHQITFPSIRTQIDETTYRKFGLSIDDPEEIPEEEVTPVAGEIRTFQDSSANTNTYINSDGGDEANAELQNDTNFDNKNPDEEFTLTKPTFFSKYRFVILFFLLLLGFGLYWVQKNGLPFQRNRQNNNNQQNKVINASNHELSELKEQIDSIRITSVSMQEELNRLKFRVTEFQDQFNPISLLDDPKEPNEVKSETTTDSETTTFEWNDLDETNIIPVLDSSSNHTVDFFMPIPNEQGIFDSNEATDIFKRPYSVYQFLMVSTDDKHAEFKIYDDIATMIRALDNFDTYLRPVCRSSSILHKNATKIITVDNGVAIKEEGQWRVITKAVIKYG